MKKPKIESMVVAEVVTLALFMYLFVGLTSVAVGTLFFDMPLSTKFVNTTAYVLFYSAMILEARKSIKEINARNGRSNSI